jgi:hypothetical protein
MRPFSAKEEKAARVALLEQYREAKRVEAFTLFNELPESKREDYTKEYEIRVVEKNPALKRTWAIKGLDSAMAKAFFVAFLAEEMWGQGWDNPSDAQLLNFQFSLN